MKLFSHHSEDAKRKIGEAQIGEKGHWYGKKFSKETKKKMSEIQKGHKHIKMPSKISYERILKEIPELEKQEFKCVPIGRVIPDIIAIKNGKIYAIEVEYGKPNYNKYNRDDYRSYFEDVIWIVRREISERRYSKKVASRKRRKTK